MRQKTIALAGATPVSSQVAQQLFPLHILTGYPTGSTPALRPAALAEPLPWSGTVCALCYGDGPRDPGPAGGDWTERQVKSELWRGERGAHVGLVLSREE